MGANARHSGAGDDERGSALILVVGATAALSALALATLSAALLAYEVAVLEHEGTAARLLATSGLELTGTELAAGRYVPSPAADTEWTPPLPPAPPGAAPLPAGCGVRVLLSAVDAGPSPPPPVPPGEDPPPLLVDAVAEARCGRGLDRREARFAIEVGGSVTRLY